MKRYTITRSLAKMTKNVHQALPTLLSALSVGGVVATGILSAKKTLAVKEKLDKLHEENDTVDTKDILLTAAQEYAEVIAVGAATSVCIIGANVLNKKSQATIAGAYALLSQSYEEYKKKTKEIVGEEKEKEIRKAIIKDAYTSLKDCPDAREEGQCLFYDEYGDRFFFRTMLEVTDAEYNLNRILAVKGYASLNDFYKLLGLDETEYGEYNGWNLYNDPEEWGCNWIDFEHILYDESWDRDSVSFYTISMPFPPHSNYLDI